MNRTRCWIFRSISISLVLGAEHDHDHSLYGLRTAYPTGSSRAPMANGFTCDTGIVDVPLKGASDALGGADEGVFGGSGD